uniref:cytochrome P450 CYP72A219-like n=1 Tax=Erigeron canadensis TaxID=72917 RepID=UPI001CB91DC2|nr:cytochrome P450 CYP72A219-like [Erigeron canadensis]
MEVSGVVLWVIVLVLVWYVLRFLNWVWFRPKKMEKRLRAQGLKGSSYKLLFGDLKEVVNMLKDAKSKPINLSDNIVPRVVPFDYKSLNTYGKICFTWLGPRPLVHISEPTMIKEILAKNYEFQKMRGGNPLARLLGTGLADAETDRWAKHRKLINPAFHVEKLKHMVPAIYMSCAELVNKWEEMLPKESSCEIDVWPYLQRLSADVVSRTAFGSSFEEGRKIFELQRELAELVIQALQSIYIPGSSFLPTKKNKRMKEIDTQVQASIRSIINKRTIAMKEGHNSNDDLLGILLESNNKEIKLQGNISFGLSINEVIEECKLFYFAGQETTGNLLVWTLILLAQHTNWQARARDEVSQIFGDKKPDIDGLNRLKIVNMILNEVLRLYPPVVALGRMAHQDTKLGDITIPAGSFIQLQTLLLHHDRDIWGDDAHEFKPERFSEGVSKVMTKGQTSYLPFGGGPRICIGQNFALVEAKMALTMILQHFEFELSPSYSHGPHTIVTLQPQFGAHLNMRRV